MADIRVTGYLDDFNRANEDPLDGVNNTEWALSGLVTQKLRLVTNAVTLKASQSSGDMYWTVRTYNEDVIEVWGIATGGNAAGIAWALDLWVSSSITGGSGVIDGYRVRQEVSTGGGSIILYRVTNGSTTSLQNSRTTYGIAGFTSGISSPCLLYRHTQSTNLHEAFFANSPYTSWTQAINYTESTWSGPFNIGIGLTDNSASSLHGWAGIGGGVRVPTWKPHIIRRPYRQSAGGVLLP